MEYCVKINYCIVFSSNKPLEELGEMEMWDLLKEAWESNSMDFYGNGVELWERVFKDKREYAKELPEDHRYRRY